MPTNFLLKHVIKGNIEETGGQERRRKQLLKDVEETRNFWKLKKVGPDRPVRRTRFASGSGPVVKTKYIVVMIMMMIIIIIIIIIVHAGAYSLSAYLSINNPNH